MSKPILPGCETLPPMKRRKPSTDQNDRRGKRKAGDRFGSINAFLDFDARDLSRCELLVWLLLWRDTKPSELARTSQADLARRAGTDPRTVRRAIGKLIAKGLLIVAHRGGLRRGMSSYRVRSISPKVRGRGCPLT